jgi:DNA-binding CsgD family transcriptional regulator
MASTAALASVCATWLGNHDLGRALWQEVIDLNLARDVRSRIWFDRATVWKTWAESGAQAAVLAAIDGRTIRRSATPISCGARALPRRHQMGLGNPAADRLEPLARPDRRRARAGDGAACPRPRRGDALGLERAASAFEQLGSCLYAAEAMAQAQQMYLRQGRMRLGRVAAARASMLSAHCAGVRTPALADVAAVPLTPREMEIARLAADGMSSRELAERLGISVRTVDNHLGTVYAKLGVSTREELPSVIGTRLPE